MRRSLVALFALVTAVASSCSPSTDGATPDPVDSAAPALDARGSDAEVHDAADAVTGIDVDVRPEAGEGGAEPVDAAMDSSAVDARVDAAADSGGRPDAGASDASDASDAGTEADTSDSGTKADASLPSAPGVSKVLKVFDNAHIYFTGDVKTRYAYQTVTFPDQGTYDKITMTLTLGCPAGGCDPWDRRGDIGIVLNRDASDPNRDEILELGRFATPYGVGGTWTYDLTDLRPVLSGAQQLRVFADTWVDGWTATITIDMHGGTPAKEPLFVVPLWSVPHVGYGVPSHPVSADAPAKNVTVPAPVSALALRAIITGHGQGNKDNCAEFCAKDHYFKIGSASHTQRVWRDDCATTAVPSNGTWKYSRAGWCPGANVRPITVDISADVSAEMKAGRASFSVAYDVEAYDNTCRPDNCVAASCALGTGCNYDNGNHTDPYYTVTAVLIGYR
jgi:hypothetical protein